MSLEDKDPIEIEIADGGTQVIEPEIIIDETKAAAPKPDSVDEGLRNLQEKLAIEQRGRADAERTANELSQTAHASRNEAQDANLHLVTGAIAQRKQAVEMAKASYREAMANQDYDAVADLQMEMATLAADLRQLEQGKQALESAPKTAAPRIYTPDPVEAFAAQLSPRSASWVRAHPEYVTSPQKNAKMLAAHQLAMADGIDVDSDDYFQSIEGTLRMNTQREAAPSEATADAAQITQRRSSPPAAPVSRSGAAPGVDRKRVTLSADERDMARNMGMSDQEYAKNKLALINDGRLH